MAASPTKTQERAARRQELNLAIDHRLGVDFPSDRRDALWAIQEQVEKKRTRLVFKYLLRRIFSGWLIRDVQNLTDFMIDEYAKVLTSEELENYFNFRDGQRPSLPIDKEQLKK